MCVAALGGNNEKNFYKLRRSNYNRRIVSRKSIKKQYLCAAIKRGDAMTNIEVARRHNINGASVNTLRVRAEVLQI